MYQDTSDYFIVCSFSVSSQQSYSSDEDTDDTENVIYPKPFISSCILPKKIINRGRWTREEVCTSKGIFSNLEPGTPITF